MNQLYHIVGLCPQRDLGGSGFQVPTNTADSDQDGMADAWEVKTSGDLTTLNALGDEDGDGLSNVDEFHLQTDPLSPVTNGASDADVDTDGDGLSNLQEADLNLDPWICSGPFSGRPHEVLCESSSRWR